MKEDTHKVFVGFWPMLEHHGEVDEISLDSCGRPDDESQKRCREVIWSSAGPGWEMSISADYLSLLHLEELEPALRNERSQDKSDLALLSMSGTSRAWPKYVEALNALYFLMFAACNTGRNSMFLHDFSELSFWDCERVLFSDDRLPIRHAKYGRTTDPYLRRFGLRSYEKPPNLAPIDHEIFDDAAYYWSVLYDLKLVPLASLGAKLFSEHRLDNYRVTIALAWFEIEAWIFELATTLGISTKTKKGWDRPISDVIDDFPAGTTVANVNTELSKLRKKRNKIAHDNADASLQDSSLALELFLYVLKMKSGLCLNAHTHRPPTLGLA